MDDSNSSQPQNFNPEPEPVTWPALFTVGRKVKVEFSPENVGVEMTIVRIKKMRGHIILEF